MKAPVLESMAINFKEINLSIIDISTNATPDIFINQKGITFTKRVLEDLNYPQNVQYCMDAEKKVFAIRACKSNEAKATPFSKPRGEQTATLSCNNRNIHDVVAIMIPGYDSTKRYKASGYLDAENRVLYYDMTEAEVCMFRASDKTE